MWLDDLAPGLRLAIGGVMLAVLLLVLVCVSSLVETRAASAPLDAPTPCEITVWQMSGRVLHARSRSWPTVEHQMGGGVRVVIETEQGREEIGGMFAYHVRRLDHE